MTTEQEPGSVCIATFADKGKAEQAVEDLHHVGFTSDQIRYSEQYNHENFMQALVDLQIFAQRAQSPTESDVTAILQKMGMSEQAIQSYMSMFKGNNPVVIVRHDGRVRDALSTMQRDGGQIR